jgi:hypothetical protein
MIERHDLAESPSIPPSSTFVVRLWHEWAAEGPRWRGQIEHVQSGEAAAFLELEGMLSFLRRFGMGSDDQGEQLIPGEM